MPPFCFSNVLYTHIDVAVGLCNVTTKKKKVRISIQQQLNPHPRTTDGGVSIFWGIPAEGYGGAWASPLSPPPRTTDDPFIPPTNLLNPPNGLNKSDSDQGIRFILLKRCAWWKPGVHGFCYGSTSQCTK